MCGSAMAAMDRAPPGAPAVELHANERKSKPVTAADRSIRMVRKATPFRIGPIGDMDSANLGQMA